MLVEHFPNPIEAAPRKVSCAYRYSDMSCFDALSLQIASTYTGPLNTPIAESMIVCDPDGPVVVHITKLFPSADAEDFHAFGRVLSGTVTKGMRVKVLGEGYSIEDEEDMVVETVRDVWISESRFVLLSYARPSFAHKHGQIFHRNGWRSSGQFRSLRRC